MIVTRNNRGLLVLMAMVLFATALPRWAVAQEPKSAPERALADARRLYNDGNMAEALTVLQTFEGQHQFSAAMPQVIYLQGWCWAGMQKYHEAISTFDRIIKGYPATALVPDAILKQAECYRELKNYSKAVDLYRLFETKYPKHDLLPRARLGEAWALFKQGDLENAQDIIQKVRDQFADDTVAVLDAQFLLGQILTAQKDYNGALQIYEQIAADQTNPRTSEGFFLGGEAFFDVGRYADAITCYKNVRSRSNLLQRVREQLGDLESQRATPTAHARRASDLRQLQAAIQAGPNLHASALFRMASCYQSLGHPEEACDTYRELLNTYSSDHLAEQAQLGLIQGLIGRRQFDQAASVAKGFQEKHHDSALAGDALFFEGEALFGLNQFQEALDRFQKFAAANPGLRRLEAADFRIAACYYGRHDFGRARDGFLAFLRRHPDATLTPDVLYRLGRSDFELSRKTVDPKAVRADLADAAASYELLRTKYPTNELMPEATFQLGYMYAYLGAQDIGQIGSPTTNFEKAVALFQEFVNRWPDSPLVPEALYQIAANQFAQSRFAAALSTYKHLVEKFPDSPLAPFGAYEIANCYAGERKPAEMIGALRSFVAHYPDHARVGKALYTIGSQLETELKIDEAIAEYRNLIKRAVAAPKPSDDLRDAAIASELRIAKILEARARMVDAVADCESFLGTFKDEPIAVRAMIMEIADIYRDAGKVADAYTKLDQLTTQYRQNVNVRIAAATSTVDLALSDNDTPRAYTAAQQLLADPEQQHLPSPTYIAIGNALLRRKEFARARDAYEKSLALYPDDPRTVPFARLGLGEVALGLNQLDEAEGIFNQVIADDLQGTFHDRAELDLARVYLARGHSGGSGDPNNLKAVDMLNGLMARAKGENAGETAYLLGNYFFDFQGDQQNKKTALAYYLRAALLTNGPHAEEAAFRSGLCHVALGNADAARSVFQAYLRRFPNGEFAADAKKELASLPARPQQS